MKRPFLISVYDVLPFAVFGFFVLCFALDPASAFFTHDLGDPDNFMRLNEVTSWLQGQSWYDLSVPRMSPGANAVIHWSRFIDLPIALVALPFIPAFGIPDAVYISGLIVPFVWFAALLALLPVLAGKFIKSEHSKFSCILLLFMPFVLGCFGPGRVDHHGAQIFIAGFALLGLVRIILGDKGWLFAVLSALALACGFWISAEALPWAIVFVFCLALAAAMQKEIVAKNAAVFGVCFSVFIFILLPIALPPAEFSSLALTWFSPAYAILAALCGAVFVLGWIIGEKIEDKTARISLYWLLGVGAGTVFLSFVPNMLYGPFADFDTFNATVLLDSIIEAQPLANSLRFNHSIPASLIPATVTFFRFLALPLVGLFVCFYAARRECGQRRLIWLAQGVFLLASIILTVFWRMRVGKFMELFTIVPLTYLLVVLWEGLKRSGVNRPLFWAELGAFILVGLLPAFLLPAFVQRAPITSNVVSLPPTRGASFCKMGGALSVLNDPAGLSAKPLTIMAPGDVGPQILFLTPHNVVAGNFNVPGNKDAFAFFGATRDDDAKDALQRWAADLVLVCRSAPRPYFGKDYYSLNHMALLPGKDGLLHLTNTDPVQPLIARLIKGQVPVWLKPIEIPAPTDYLLFRVQLPKG